MRTRRLVTVLAAGAVMVGAGVLANGGSGQGPDVADASSAPGFVPAEPAVRLVDTRPGESTVDGAGAGIGERAADSVLEVPVADRASLPADAAAVVLNLAVVGAAEPGHVTAYACDVDRPFTSNLNHRAGTTRAGMVIVGLDADGTVCIYTSGRTHLIVDAVGVFGAGALATGSPVRLLDTRSDGVTVDGARAGEGSIEAGTVVRVPAVGRGAIIGDGGNIVLTATVVDPAAHGHASVFTCDSPESPSSTVNFRPGDVIANVAVVRPDAAGDVCVFVSAATHLVVDSAGQLAADALAVADRPYRVLDTRSEHGVADAVPDTTGIRSPSSTTAVPAAGVAGVPSEVSAVLVNVTVAAAASPGFLTLHQTGERRPGTSTLNHGEGEVIANAALVPVGTDGNVCLFTLAATHVVIDVVGWVPGSPTASGECPGASPFAERRIVALYGTDVDDRMGALGEQPPTEAADRLAEVAAPYEAAGDRPVQGAFELIATIATAAPGPDSLYRSVASDQHVQRYLDVAAERGLLLILDIQPGRSDFLTELRRYERFLREPIVHVALDPEWKVGPDEVPGDLVGQVDAAEVNEVADYLAEIVAEEDLPDKLLVVHQFQDRMLTNRSLLRNPAGVVINIHMDGFGTRSQKLTTYSIVQVEPPFSNGFKLFYDEDIDIFQPHEVLELDPVPDLITYQ